MQKHQRVKLLSILLQEPKPPTSSANTAARRVKN